MSTPTMVGFDSPMFAKDAQGRPITRDRTCLCGRRYTQGLLSERFLAMIERAGTKAQQAFARQVPDFYVPVECPRCERRAIGHEARKAGEPFFVTRSEAAD